jgi:outer membrane protein assembly factor BamB
MSEFHPNKVLPGAYRLALPALAALALAAAPARAALGDPLWKFFADFGVTVAEPVPDLTGNGGQDALIGSADDSLYLVEARGAGAGFQVWSAPFKATLSSAIALPDLTGDGKPEVAAGDELGLIACLNGADGKALWKFLTFGTVLSLAALPDADGDGAADVAVASENDTVFCLSGKPGSALGKSIWVFASPGGKAHGPPGGSGRLFAAKATAAPPPKDQPSGANSLALLAQKTGPAFGLAVGTSADTVYCLATANGAVKWKTGLPGDIWKVAAFPDQTGDGVEELLLACGADAGYLLNGATGAVIWSHAVSLGATAVAVAPDMDGDGLADALIGDGNGTVHCVSGISNGANVKAAWTYSFGDTSTILSLAVPGDLDKDGRPECAVGTSNDTVALLSGKGARLWARGLGGEVPVVAALGEIDANGSPDLIAGTEMGFAQAYSGGGAAVLLERAWRARALRTGAGGIPPSALLFRRPGAAGGWDGRGRLILMP